jgi:hypothetical protein
MYAVIIKNGSQYELQLKDEIDTTNVSHSGRSSNVELLKQSITAEWKDYVGDKENIVFVAKIV